jgi:hypothetical protein
LHFLASLAALRETDLAVSENISIDASRQTFFSIGKKLIEQSLTDMTST